MFLEEQAVGQLLQFPKETAPELAKHKEQIQQLHLIVAELRAQLKVYVEKEGSNE